MFDWLIDHVEGIPSWLTSFRSTGQLVFVAVLTAFFTACVTEPVKAVIIERRARARWRRFVYQELAEIYAAILWNLDHAMPTHSPDPEIAKESRSKADSVLRESFKEPFKTPRFDTAKDEPAFYELPEANTIERIHWLIGETYTPTPNPKRVMLSSAGFGELRQALGIIHEFRSCLFPQDFDWKWELNAFRVPLDRPLDAQLFYRCLRRQDLKKERWVLEAADVALGRPVGDYRDGDGILSKGEHLLLPPWVRAFYRSAYHLGNGALKVKTILESLRSRPK